VPQTHNASRTLAQASATLGHRACAPLAPWRMMASASGCRRMVDPES
jgi:hypothetical protein